MAFSSHGDIAGAFQPVEAFSSSRLTCAPLGGSRSSTSLSTSPAALPSSVGGRRSESFTAVCGRSTLPADSSDGMPSIPVSDSAGRQVRLSTSSSRSSDIGVLDRKSVVWGKGVSVRVDLGGGRRLNKKKYKKIRT